MGIPAKQRPSRFEESLDIMRRLWAGEAVSSNGRFTMTDARIAPVPAEPVEVWIGAVAPAAVDRAARLGDGWLGAPAFGKELARTQIAAYRDACARQNRPVGVCAIRRDIYVGETAKEARATAGPVIDGGYRGFPEDAPVVGNVEQVAEAFRALGEMGYDDIIVRHLVQDQGRVLSSIGRLEDVRALLD
jgi:alkanesulfonate monooxygenase SsuD/methylene tetrahydromethanopterin reductase-like flavin-dependent oxidoreductase (luciferase family)